MATNSAGIDTTFTASSQNSDTFHLPRGGAFAIDAIRAAGSGTLALEISFNGSTFIPARDAEGNLVTASLDGTTQHWHHEGLTQVDVYYRLVSSSFSSGNILVRMRRVISE